MECHRWNFDVSDDALLVCRDQHPRSEGCNMRPMHPAEVLSLVNTLRARIMDVRAFVVSDTAAATYQTLGQYRAELLRLLDA